MLLRLFKLIILLSRLFVEALREAKETSMVGERRMSEERRKLIMKYRREPLG